jgi:hypothetical protein
MYINKTEGNRKIHYVTLKSQRLLRLGNDDHDHDHDHDDHDDSTTTTTTTTCHDHCDRRRLGWAATTETGPNDASGVVWDLGTFFFVIFRVFLY